MSSHVARLSTSPNRRAKQISRSQPTNKTLELNEKTNDLKEAVIMQLQIREYTSQYVSQCPVSQDLCWFMKFRRKCR